MALTYSSNRQAIDELVSSLRGSDSTKEVKISIHKVDLEDVQNIENLFKEIQEQHSKSVDILISNAGYGKRIQNVW